MKLPLCLIVFCLAAAGQSKEASSAPAGVPAGAVAVEGRAWRWVDKDGKAWLYRPTPLGMTKSEEPKQGSVKRPASVPADAVSVAEGVWRWVSPEKKVWMFQETPSGVMKTEEPAGGFPAVGPIGLKVADERPDAVLDLISVKEDGDLLRFSRPGPFGMYSWVKKKTELDRDELIVWERARAKSAAAKKE